MQTWTKDIGTVSLSYGDLRVVADSAQGYTWATRPGMTWPCSEIRYLDHVCAHLDSRNGDLVDLVINGGEIGSDEIDLSSDELTAWIDDCLVGTPFAHLARTQA